jgi:predicted DNA-binding transcriptional regulator YafY
MTTPASRLITLIMLMQRQPSQKAARLAAELGISVRTLHRYFAMLDEMGIPIYAERGPQGGFSLVRGYKMPPLVLTPEEAVAVALGTGMVEQVWGQLYCDPARGARAKLENLLPEEQRQEVAWALRSLIVAGALRFDPRSLDSVLEVLRIAVREQRRVNLAYQGGSAPHPELRAVDTYALVYRWGWWYTVGYCHLRQGMRSFRVDRMQTVSLTTQSFTRPADFDIQAYLVEEGKSQPQIHVRMRFTPQGAHIARYNRVYWEALEEGLDGSVLVTWFAPDLNWAASSVLAYGPLVTVLEPPVLRQMVADWALSIAHQYTAE